jgi:hypothetical protein
MIKSIVLSAILLGSMAGSSPLPSVPVSYPYKMILTFPDRSLVICPVSDFTLDYLTLTVNAETCVSDNIFKNGFD